MNICGLLATVPCLAAAQPAGAAPLEHRPNGLAASSAHAGMQITAMTNSIIRVRIAQGGKFPEDASWAVPASVRRQSVNVTQTDDGFKTRALNVHVDPQLGLTVNDTQGRTIDADASNPLTFEARSFMLRKKLPIPH